MMQNYECKKKQNNSFVTHLTSLITMNISGSEIRDIVVVVAVVIVTASFWLK